MCRVDEASLAAASGVGRGTIPGLDERRMHAGTEPGREGRQWNSVDQVTRPDVAFEPAGRSFPLRSPAAWLPHPAAESDREGRQDATNRANRARAFIGSSASRFSVHRQRHFGGGLARGSAVERPLASALLLPTFGGRARLDGRAKSADVLWRR